MGNTLALRAVNGLHAGATFRITAPAAAVIGRGSDCNLCLSEGIFTQAISRHHCRIEVTPMGAFIRDLGSRNGTFLNNKNIGQRPRGRVPVDGQSSGPRHLVADGDQLRVGDLEFAVGLAADRDAGVVGKRRRLAGVSSAD